MARQLITLQEYKLHAGISSTEFDDKLNQIINRVSEVVKTHCNRLFIDAFDPQANQFLAIVEYAEHDGYYFPNEFPVQELISVEYSSDLGTTYTPVTAVFDRVKEGIYIEERGRYGPNAFKITYTGGFKTTPEDLKLAVIDLVDYYYRGESSPRKSSGTNVIEYVTTSDMPPHIKRVLDLYRVL